MKSKRRRYYSLIKSRSRGMKGEASWKMETSSQIRAQRCRQRRFASRTNLRVLLAAGARALISWEVTAWRACRRKKSLRAEQHNQKRADDDGPVARRSNSSSTKLGWEFTNRERFTSDLCKSTPRKTNDSSERSRSKKKKKKSEGLAIPNLNCNWRCNCHWTFTKVTTLQHSYFHAFNFTQKRTVQLKWETWFKIVSKWTDRKKGRKKFNQLTIHSPSLGMGVTRTKIL